MSSQQINSWPTQECGQKRRRFKCIKRSLSGWSRVHVCKWILQGPFQAKKPEDDSYKGRAQRHLDDRVMRMMRARRTTFSGNNMSAGLDENLNLNLRWRLRFQASIVRWNRCCRWDEKLRVEEVYKTTGLGFYGRRFRGTRGKLLLSWNTGSQHPTSTIQVYIFWGKLCSNLLWSIGWKANTWGSFLQQSSGWCMWRSLTEDIEPWDEWRTITKGQGRHRIQEGSTSRGCKIGRQRVEALWWTDQRSYRIIFGRRVYWQKSWKCWVIIKGIDSPSLEA